jgi:hypothetical protein
MSLLDESFILSDEDEVNFLIFFDILIFFVDFELIFEISLIFTHF